MIDETHDLAINIIIIMLGKLFLHKNNSIYLFLFYFIVI